MSSSNSNPKYIARYKIVKQFPFKKYTKRKPRKPLFLLYCRKKAGGDSCLAVRMEHRKWKT